MLASVVPAPSPGDPRTPTQRRADGFTEFCKDYLSRSDRSDVGSERPNVIRERMNGGTHELSNLVLLCTYHHREVHRRGITLTWEGPALIATLPSGVMLHGPPQPATTPWLN
jgi:hypothetical protein